MKYLILAIIACSVVGCSPGLREAMKPNHLGITPSCEWEIQEGHNVKHKPKIQTSLDWNF